MKTLIVYYSKKGENWFNGEKKILEKGNTELVAQYLKDICNGDMFQIVMKNPYPMDYDECCKKAYDDVNNNVRPILENDIDISKYENIFICYPIYWSTCPMAILSFIKDKDFTSKNVYLISTHEGSGLGSSKYNIEKGNITLKIKNSLPIPGTLASKSYNRLKNFVDENLIID